MRLDGVYPPTPGSQRAFSATGDLYWSGCVFDASGAVWCVAASASDVRTDPVFKAELRADAGEVVYTEADDPLVLIGPNTNQECGGGRAHRIL